MNIPPTIIVIFGASGDLTARKLAPAIFNLSQDGLLPSKCFLIGYGRKEINDGQFRNYLKKSLELHSRRKIHGDACNIIAENVQFHAGSYDNSENFNGLGDKIKIIEKKLGEPAQCLFYISTPPGVFKPILENLGISGLAKRHSHKEIW